MKKILLSVIGIAAIAMTGGMFPESMEAVFAAGGVMASLPLWFVMKGEVKTFQEITKEQAAEMSDEEYGMYQAAKFDNLKGELTKEIAKESKASADRLEALQKEINETRDEAFLTLKKAMIKQSEVIAEMKEEGVSKDSETFKTVMKAKWDENVSELKGFTNQNASFEFELKAEQTYGDITSGSDFAQMKPGITDIPVRKSVFRSLFRTLPLSTEVLKYTEQATVVRDAQNVAECAAVTSTTKETLTVSEITTKVIQDEIDFCSMFISDYPFMESRVRKLLEESINLRIDQQMLLGTGAGNETFSISSVSSEFSAAAASCVLTASIEVANLVDLISGMATQIYELGQQNSYVPNVAVVNNCDWFKNVWSLKDANGNYLDPRVVVQDGKIYVATLSGLIEVITSPIVAQNTCYVFDSTKGEIIDRQKLNISISFENKDNFVNHIATLLGYERMNLLIENNNANAFMKCSDVTTAIAAILKP